MNKGWFIFLFSAFLLISFLFLGNRLGELNAQQNITNEETNLELENEKDRLFGMLHKEDIESIVKSGCGSEEHSLSQKDREQIIDALKKIKAEKAKKQEHYYGGTYLNLIYKNGKIDSISMIDENRIIYNSIIYEIKQDNTNIYTMINACLNKPFGGLHKNNIQSITATYYDCIDNETYSLSEEDEQEIIWLLNAANGTEIEKPNNYHAYDRTISLNLKYKDGRSECIYFVENNIIQYQDTYYEMEQNSKEELDMIYSLIEEYL